MGPPGEPTYIQVKREASFKIIETRAFICQDSKAEIIINWHFCICTYILFEKAFSQSFGVEIAG